MMTDQQYDKIYQSMDLTEADIILSTGDFGGSDKMLKMIFKHLGDDWTKYVSKKVANELVKEDYNSGKKMIDELNELGGHVHTVHGNWDFVLA